MTQLRELNLNSAPLNDAGMAHLRSLTALEKLSLNYTDVTDPGLEPVSGLPNIVELDLAGADIRDAGLAHVSKLPKLEVLNLSFTRFTDAGLVHLAALKQLRRSEPAEHDRHRQGHGGDWQACEPRIAQCWLHDGGRCGLVNLSGLTKLTDAPARYGRSDRRRCRATSPG